VPLYPKLSRLRRARGSQPGTVSPQAWNALVDYVGALERRIAGATPQPSPDIAFKYTTAGFTAHLKRRGGGGGGGSSALCPFGELITRVEGDDPPVTITSIRGGVFYAGDQNFSVAAYDLTLGTPGDWLVQIQLTGIEPNMDDDEEILLPGIATATGTPTWQLVDNSTPTNYGDTVPPTVTTDGTLIVPIGRLIIADGAATFDPTACGNITAAHCAGTLSHIRV
jgi:hypothetical protein